MKIKMMYLAVILSPLLFAQPAEAQFLKGLGKKLEKKTEEVAEKAIGRIGNSDEVTSEERRGESRGADGQRGTAGTGPFEGIPLLKNDFVRGSEIIFFDDFSTETIGEM